MHVKGFGSLSSGAPRDIFNDALDVFVSLEDDYCTNGFCYFIEVTTPKFLSTVMEKENSTFLSPNYPCIIVSKLTDDIIKVAIESFINLDDQARWLKLYDIMPKLNIYSKHIFMLILFLDTWILRKKLEQP